MRPGQLHRIRFADGFQFAWSPTTVLSCRAARRLSAVGDGVVNSRAALLSPRIAYDSGSICSGTSDAETTMLAGQPTHASLIENAEAVGACSAALAADFVRVNEMAARIVLHGVTAITPGLVLQMKRAKW